MRFFCTFDGLIEGEQASYWTPLYAHEYKDYLESSKDSLQWEFNFILQRV